MESVILTISVSSYDLKSSFTGAQKVNKPNMVKVKQMSGYKRRLYKMLSTLWSFYIRTMV